MTQQPQEPLGPFCQSCGMPLMQPTDFGTLENGYRQNDYCHFCYADGAFTNPDTTLAEMIETVIPFTVEATGMPEAQARAIAEEQLPNLKRWNAAAS